LSTSPPSTTSPPPCAPRSPHKPHTVDDKTVKGINFFDPTDNALLHALQNPPTNIVDIRRADLLSLLDHLSPRSQDRYRSPLSHHSSIIIPALA